MPSLPKIDDERFKQIATTLIAIVTLLAAIVAYLQNDASTQNERANNQAQEAALREMGVQIAGAIATNFHLYGAYDQWYALDIAAQGATGAERDALEAGKNAIRAVSPFLAAPYFDPELDEAPDETRFAVDTYVEEATALTERFADRIAVKQAWNAKASTYILHLTLLAVALFLFGIALTIDNQVRWIFLSAGVLLTGLAAAWVLATYVTPVPSLDEEAIDAYAEGIGLSYQERYAEARVAFDKALALEPGYGNAYLDRAEAEYSLRNYPAAIADYLAAQHNGSDNADTAWGLGWSYYLLGDYANAIPAYEHALELGPGLVGARLDLALVLLAAGQMDGARAEYDRAIADTVALVEQARMNRSQPPASLWTVLEYASTDVDNLVAQVDGVLPPWGAAPPRATIADPAAARAAAVELARAVKDASVALEFGGQLSSGGATVTVTPFTFGRYLVDANGDLTGEIETATSFAAGIDEVVVLFDYAGAQDGMREIWKIYVDGDEDPSWRIDEQWALGPDGSAAKTLGYEYSEVFSLEPGTYRVELFLDYRLVQSGEFTVAAE